MLTRAFKNQSLCIYYIENWSLYSF